MTLAVASPVWAGDPYDVKDGFYMGGSWVHNGMSGEFDDTMSLVRPPDPDIYDVPDVDDGMGFGVFLGWRFMKGALEIGYHRSTHDTTTSLVGMPDSDAVYNVVDLNLKVDVFHKIDFLARHRIRPYVLAGFGVPWLTIEDGSTDGVSLRDETFVGYAANVGAGIAYYFDPQWALTGGVIHRWNWFRNVESIKIDGSLEERTLGFTVGIAYTF
jgi:hypothetical protein